MGLLTLYTGYFDVTYVRSQNESARTISILIVKDKRSPVQRIGYRFYKWFDMFQNLHFACTCVLLSLYKVMRDLLYGVKIRIKNITQISLPLV